MLVDTICRVCLVDCIFLKKPVGLFLYLLVDFADFVGVVNFCLVDSLELRYRYILLGVS